MKHCPDCGETLVGAEPKFCSECGNSLPHSSGPATRTQDVQPAHDPSQAPAVLITNNNGVVLEQDFIDLMTDPLWIESYWDNSGEHLRDPELIEAAKVYTFEKMLDVMNWTQKDAETFFILTAKTIDTALQMPPEP